MKWRIKGGLRFERNFIHRSRHKTSTIRPLACWILNKNMMIKIQFLQYCCFLKMYNKNQKIIFSHLIIFTSYFMYNNFYIHRENQHSILNCFVFSIFIHSSIHRQCTQSQTTTKFSWNNKIQRIRPFFHEFVHDY